MRFQLFSDPPSSYSGEVPAHRLHVVRTALPRSSPCESRPVQFRCSPRICSSPMSGSWSAQLGRAAHYWFLHRCKSSTYCAVIHDAVHTAGVCRSPHLQRVQLVAHQCAVSATGVCRIGTCTSGGSLWDPHRQPCHLPRDPPAVPVVWYESLTPLTSSWLLLHQDPLHAGVVVVQVGDARHAVQGSCVCSPASAISSYLVGRPWPCSSETLAMRFGARTCAVQQVPSLPLQSVDHAMQLRDA